MQKIIVDRFRKAELEITPDGPGGNTRVMGVAMANPVTLFCLLMSESSHNSGFMSHAYICTWDHGVGGRDFKSLRELKEFYEKN